MYLNECENVTNAYFLTFIVYIPYIHYIHHIRKILLCRIFLRVPPVRDLQYQRAVLDSKRSREIIVCIDKEDV